MTGFFPKGLVLGCAVLAGVLIAAGAQAAGTRHEIDTEGMARISLDVQTAHINSVLRTFSEFSGENIIAGPEVDGLVTVRLEEVPWLVALDTTLRANGYGWERVGDIIRV